MVAGGKNPPPSSMNSACPGQRPSGLVLRCHLAHTCLRSAHCGHKCAPPPPFSGAPQELINRHKDELAASVTREQGKTLADAHGDVFRGLGGQGGLGRLGNPPASC